ncbi:zf-HC2 domain-containing protein [Paenibacillus sp. BAC0078]
MTRISCDVIQDLLPLYYDGICSTATKELVEEHLMECEHCQSSLDQIKSNLSLPIQAMEQNKLEGSGLKRIKRIWNRAQAAAFVKGLIVAVSVSGILVLGYLGLFRWDIIPVPTDHLKVSNIRIRANGEIAFRFQINDGYTVKQVNWNAHDDGSYYITPVRPLIKSKKIAVEDWGFLNGEFYINPEGLRKTKHGKDVRITAIYYGPLDNPILIWKKGTELPVGK